MKEKIVKLILEQTRKNYDLIAPAFSETRQRFWPDFNFFEKYIQEGDDVLDIGCGNGRFYEFLKDKKINYKGVDNSSNLISEAKKRYPVIVSSFEVGDILDFKPEAKFDKIFCLAVLPHLPSQALRFKALSNLRKILKEEGMLFLTCWNLFNRKYRPYIIKHSFLKIFPQEIMPGLKSTELDFKDVFIPWKKMPDKKIVLRLETKSFQSNRKGVGETGCFPVEESSEPHNSGASAGNRGFLENIVPSVNEAYVLRYYHAFTLGELAALVKKAGFKVIAQFYSKTGKISTLSQAHNLILICQPRSKFTKNNSQNCKKL